VIIGYIVIKSNDNIGSFGSSVTWRIMQFGESGDNHKYHDRRKKAL
jgi:hypothetical protein